MCTYSEERFGFCLFQWDLGWMFADQSVDFFPKKIFICYLEPGGLFFLQSGRKIQKLSFDEN